ncbi:MAG: tetratricopeptide repeat protein, partial [Desulfobulbales bacterium]
KLGDLDKSLEILMDIFDHHAETRNPEGTVEVLETIAEVYLEKNDNQKAADALRTIAGIHRNFNHKRLAEEYGKRAQRTEKA